MSKLSFRARALDPSKSLNIHIAEELPDLTEYSAINRAVPQMPSGMEKEEESEHHLQRAICTGLIIPTPEVFDIDQEFYDRNYPENYKVSRQLIRMQPLGIEQDIPDYDMDSADEMWINTHTRRFDLTPLKFEEMMDRLEKSSGQTVVTLNEAKALLKQDDEISIAVYDYWLNKRLTTQQPLILSVKTENRAGSAANNPYIAFRRRTEKMQTRKNRKNDETSYEKMLKLRRNLNRALTILEMIKRREKTKREHVHLGIEIFEKRYQARDFNGHILAEFTSSAVKSSRPAFAPIYANQYSSQQSNQPWPNAGSQYHPLAASNNASSGSAQINKRGGSDGDAALANNIRKEKRQYKKRKHKNQRDKPPYPTPGPTADAMVSSDEEEQVANNNNNGTSSNNHLRHETEDDGLFPFRRSNANQYHRPLIHTFGNWPWESRKENGLANPKYRFTLTSIRHPKPRCIGFARRRRGRGGRIILDRVSTNLDDFWANLDYTIYDSSKLVRTKSNDLNSLHGEHGAADQDSMNANGVRTEASAQSDSVVIDLVTNLNNNNSATNKANTKFNRKMSAESGSGINNVNNNNNGSGTSNYDRTKSLSHSEHIVIKKEQKQTITDFDNCLESINNNLNNRNSSSSNLSEALTPSLTRIISQGIQNNNLINSNLNLNSNLNSGSSLFRHPSDVRRTSVVAAAAGATTTSTNSDSRNIHSDHIGLLRGDFTEGINGETIDQSILDESVVADHQLYAEMFGDWTHFRPKTPEDEQFDSEYGSFGDAALPFFAENTSLSIELQRLTDLDTKPPPRLSATVDDPILNECPDNVFAANPFSLNDVTADERSATLLNDSLQSATGADGNVSGDTSLPEPSLSLGENEEKILDNLLEECQLDDLKTFNTNANFWNGLLDDSGGLLDVIDDKNQESDPAATGDSATDSRKMQKRKITYRPHARFGHSAFNISNLHRDEKIFKKCDPNAAAVKSTQASTTTATAVCNEGPGTNPNGVTNAVVELKKELEIGPDGNAIAVDAVNHAVNVAMPSIKLEPLDEPTSSASTIDEHQQQPQQQQQHLVNVVKPQILPVIKTEVVNSLPVVSTAMIHPRPITLQQANQMQQQQQAQLQTSQTGDQTYVLSRPIRRFTTNGPTDGKSGVQHLLINRKFQMVHQRTSSDDDKDVKPKILEGAYLKFPAEFNVVSSNNIATINAAAVTSKHNYSLPPQAQFHHQPITLIGQSSQNQNKVLMSHTGQGNLAITTPIQDMQNKLTSNIKLNLVPSLGQVIHQPGGSIVIDAKGLNATGGDHKTAILTTTTAAHRNDNAPRFAASVSQGGQLQYQAASAQQANQQMQQQQQPKVKLDKTMNMMFDSERNRVYYTNLPNKRGNAQFLAQLNPKVVNIMPIQHKNNVAGTVQGIVTSSGMLNKNLQRVITAPNQTAQNQQQQLAAALRPGTILNAAGNVISTGNSTQNLVSSSTQGNTLIIGASTATTSSINDVNTVSSNNTSTINTVLGNSGCLIAAGAANDNNLSAANKLNNSDGTTTVGGININTTNSCT